MKAVHIVCIVCRIELFGKNVQLKKKEAKKERCCKCGYATMHAIPVDSVPDNFYCQVNRVHDVPR